MSDFEPAFFPCGVKTREKNKESGQGTRGGKRRTGKTTTPKEKTVEPVERKRRAGEAGASSPKVQNTNVPSNRYGEEDLQAMCDAEKPKENREKEKKKKAGRSRNQRLASIPVGLRTPRTKRVREKAPESEWL